jgi:hypothetical protein
MASSVEQGNLARKGMNLNEREKTVFAFAVQKSGFDKVKYMKN